MNLLSLGLVSTKQNKMVYYQGQAVSGCRWLKSPVRETYNLLLRIPGVGCLAVAWVLPKVV